MCSEKLDMYTTSVTSVEDDEASLSTESETGVATGGALDPSVTRTIRVALYSEKAILTEWIDLARGIVHATTPAERELWRVTAEAQECR